MSKTSQPSAWRAKSEPPEQGALVEAMCLHIWRERQTKQSEERAARKLKLHVDPGLDPGEAQDLSH